MKNLNISITFIWSLIKFLTSREIEEIAKETGYTKRAKGVGATAFYQAFTIGIWGLHHVSLDTIASKCCELQYGLTLSKQALFKRLKGGAILLRHILTDAFAYAALYEVSTECIEILKQFKDVKICDSTVFAVSDKLKGIWKGLGGKNWDAALKIQATFSVISRKLQELEWSQATKNDANYTQNIVKNLQSMELAIFDLGYFCLKSFKAIKEKGAFFISRIKTNTLFYIESLNQEEGFNKIEKTVLTKLLKKAGKTVDQHVYIGNCEDNRIEVRLVGVRLPEDVVSERKRKANKKAKAAGKTLGNYELELLAWNLMITCVEEEMLSAETICELYRIRWQIELIFKGWKSCFEIDQVGEAGKDYLECLLYGKIIVITLMTALYSQVSFMMFKNHHKLVSMNRFFVNLREKIEILTRNLVLRIKNILQILHVLEDVIKRSIEENRKRKTTQRALMDHDLPWIVLQMVA